MDQETKEILSTPKTLYLIAIILSLFFGVACVDIYSALNHEEQQNISNFKIPKTHRISKPKILKPLL